MYGLLDRPLTDGAMRAALLADPLTAAASLGMNLTDEQAAALRASDLALATEALDERLSKRLRAGS